MIDIVGDKISNLIIIEKIKNTHYKAKCNCGFEKIYHFRTLKRYIKDGKEHTCPECKFTKIKDYVGKKFGSITILKLLRKRDHKKRPIYLGQCDCGRKQKINYQSVVSAGFNRSKLNCNCEHSIKKKYFNSKERCVGSIYSTYKKSARERSYDFKLTLKQLSKLIKNTCHYCGTEPNTTLILNKKAVCMYNGIDRMDSTKGYCLDNCVTCCENCNRAKMTLSYKEFLRLIEKIYLHRLCKTKL